MTKHQKRAISFLKRNGADAAWLPRVGPVSRDAIRNDYRLARRLCRKLRLNRMPRRPDNSTI